MKAYLSLFLALVVVACSQTPKQVNNTYDRALERASETVVEQIDKNLYLATSSSLSVEYAKSQVLRVAYETCMRQNLAVKILVQGRIRDANGSVYASQFQCTSALDANETEIELKHPK